MKRLIFILFILSPIIGLSQESKVFNQFEKKNVVYVEGLGLGRYGSINFERIVLQKQFLRVSSRVGFAMARFVNYEDKFKPDIIIPVTVQAILGRRNHWGEIGFGQVYTTYSTFSYSKKGTDREREFNLETHVGYRFQKPKGRWQYRLTYYSILDDFQFRRRWVGGSIGYMF